MDRLDAVIEKFKPLMWKVELSLHRGQDGEYDRNYRVTILCQGEGGLEAAVTVDPSHVEEPASVLVCKSYTDGTPKDEIYAEVFDFHEDQKSYMKVRDFVWNVTARERQARVSRLREARAAFFA